MQYSDTWIDTFLAVPDQQTPYELAFLQRHLPLPDFRRILDVCCGSGRHSNGLANTGYAVVGIDASERALTAARGRAAATAHFVQADMRALPVRGPFDAALIMWQSFGGFDDATNRSILVRLHGLLRPAGRLVLDIYNRGFFDEHQDVRESERDGRIVRERKWMEGARLQVRLRYDGSEETDAFDWRVFDPDEIMKEVGALGFDTICCCADFDASKPASRSVPRMQLVFGRR